MLQQDHGEMARSGMLEQVHGAGSIVVSDAGGGPGPTRVPGLFLCAGHSFNGWREATHTAQRVADQIATAAPAEGYARAWDPARFSPFY